jgi:hypothetical protein
MDELDTRKINRFLRQLNGTIRHFNKCLEKAPTSILDKQDGLFGLALRPKPKYTFKRTRGLAPNTLQPTTSQMASPARRNMITIIDQMQDVLTRLGTDTGSFPSLLTLSSYSVGRALALENSDENDELYDWLPLHTRKYRN